MKRKGEIIIAVLIALVAAGVGAGAALYLAYPTRVEVAAGAARGELVSLNAPPGTLTTDRNAEYKAPAAPAATARTAPAADWPSYNKALTSERFADPAQINAKNAGNLKVLCIYDTRQFTSFETGLIMVEGALIGTTEFDFFDRPRDLRTELAHT